MKKSWTFFNRPANARRVARPDTRLLMTAIVLLAGFALLGAGIAPGGTAVVSAQAVAPAEVAATAPLISYQGRLVDPSTGLAKQDGAYAMSFRLYTVAAGGGPLYTEARTVDVVRSIFSVPLGEVTPLDPNIFNGQPLFLGVTVGGDAEMTPRLRLAHAPYAIFAERAGVANSAALATTVVDGAITSAKIAANAVDSARVVDGSLTGVDIADGSVTSADISDGAIASAKIADGTIDLVDLNASARAPRFIDTNIFGANIAGAALFSTGFGPNAGLVLQETTFNGSFAISFTLPPDFPAGGSLNGRIVYNAAATGCQLYFAPNYISVARVGRTHIIGTGASTGLNMSTSLWTVAATSNQSSAIPFTVTSPQPTVPLQALDTISIGFFRSSPAASGDSCTVNMVIQGITLTY